MASMAEEMDAQAAGKTSSAETGNGASKNDGPATKQNKEEEPEEPFMRFRLTYLDTVQSTPFSLPPPPTAKDKSLPFIPARRIPFAPAGSNITVDRIPELRIFGATEAGQRCCIHVHGALPYVYVEYEGKVAPDEVHTYINRLARAINVCMAASLGRKDPTKSLFVAFVVPVKGVPFYGFHVGYRYFLKIYTLDPKFTIRLVTLLRSGEIMKKKFIVYEAHIPFHLQFMLDFNLFGCGWVDVSKAKFREPVPEDPEQTGSHRSDESEENDLFPRGGQYGQSNESAHKRIRKAKRYTRSSIPESMLYANPLESPSRVAHSELEFDIHVSWILNRHLVKERNMHADFTEFLKHPIPDDFKFVHSVRELWEDEKRRRQMKGLQGPFEVSENSAEELLGGLSAGARSGQDDRMYGIGTQPPWMAHNQNVERFHQLVEKDKMEYAARHPADPIPEFETFVKGEKKGGWMERIRTTFKSVEALFEETMIKDEEDCNPFGAWAVRGIGVSVPAHASRSLSAGPDDINPQYLAMLATQAGRARLAQLEAEDEAVEDEDKTEAFDASGIDQEVIPPSDEEEGQNQDETRQVEKQARRNFAKKGMKRSEALREAERTQKSKDHLIEDRSDVSDGLGAPRAAQRSPASRESSAAGDLSRSDSRDSASIKDSDTSLERQDSRESSSTEAKNGEPKVIDEDFDPDVMLLDQLVPLQYDSDDFDDKANVKQEQFIDYTVEEEAMLDNSPPTPTSESADHKLSNGFGEHSITPMKGQERSDLHRAGLGDLSQLDLDTSDFATSSPFRSLVNDKSNISAGPAVLPRATPFGGKQASTPSPVKKLSTSPSKANYFSPAKSKLRNAIVNPTFVGEAKLKRKREDELIGFRAIGDHGRTTLQRMLDVQRKPNLKKDHIKKHLGLEPLLGNRINAHAGAAIAPTAKKARTVMTSPNDHYSTSSDDEMEPTNMPLHVLLSSADGNSQERNDLSIAPMIFEALPAQTLDTISVPVTANRSDDMRDADATTASFDSIPYTPTQIIPTQDPPADVSATAMQSAERSSLECQQENPVKSDEAILPVKGRRGVRFQSEVEMRSTSPASRLYEDGPLLGNAETAEVPTLSEPFSDPFSVSKLAQHAASPGSAEAPLDATSSVSKNHPSSVLLDNRELAGLSSTARTSFIQFARPVPTLFELLRNLDERALPHKLYRDPYWSNDSDVPQHVFEYAGRRYTHQGDSNKHLQNFDNASANYRYTRSDRVTASPTLGIYHWDYKRTPPSMKAIFTAFQELSGGNGSIAKPPVLKPEYAKSKKRVLDTQWQERSQIEGPTQANAFGVKYAQVKPSNAVVKEKEHMSALAIELHVNTRGGLLPDPSQDAMQAIFYCFQNESDNIVDNGRKEGQHSGFIAVQATDTADRVIDLRKMGLSRYPIDIVEDEIDLIKALVDKVHEWDPEIFTGYDVLKDSWGYFVERVDEIAPEFDIIMELSRVKSQSTGKRGSKAEDRWGYSKGATLKVTGRHILPVWRLLKSDVNLCIYSLENVVFHILRQRVPRFSPETLTSWYQSGDPALVARVLQYHVLRAQLVVELLEEAEIVSRNAEFARVFGVDFYSVLTRGSQFKVESVMFKITKPENFMLPSPSREDVGKQNAAECIPLILEPQSGFYSSPVLVFDFQSLYPSVMIAYNLCYSTCLGRLKEFMGTNRLGTSSLAVASGCLTLLKDWVTLSPNGLMFLKPQVRRSMLSKMLTEILDTRVMVKKSMKLVDETDRALLKLLNARQLGLKFIANVTYGYTSATFSGRMPCVEIADAIVQTGRETLERAKNTIQSRPDWGAIVRYGDTDSLFVHLPGKTKDEAFTIGNEIADTITRMNPKPIKLKFEKVYLPCFLLAKKRYVGFKYESSKDKEPEFDAKGIETVRRDGFPAMQKILETSIKIMFRTADLSAVKLYVQQQYVRIMQNRSSPQDFIYAKEVKMGSYSDKVTPPPGAVVTARRMLVDPRTEALYGERVPYIISRGLDGPKAKQAARALTPEEFLGDAENALDDLHYIGRIVKTLNRLFNLVGVDTQEWWNSAPRRKTIGKSGKHDKLGRIRVDQHFGSLACPICGSRKPTNVLLCSECSDNGLVTNLSLIQRSKQLEERVHDVRAVCATCSRLPVDATDACESTDCPVLYSRVKSVREHRSTLELFKRLQISPGQDKHSDEPVYLVV